MVDKSGQTIERSVSSKCDELLCVVTGANANLLVVPKWKSAEMKSGKVTVSTGEKEKHAKRWLRAAAGLLDLRCQIDESETQELLKPHAFGGTLLFEPPALYQQPQWVNNASCIYQISTHLQLIQFQASEVHKTFTVRSSETTQGQLYQDYSSK